MHTLTDARGNRLAIPFRAYCILELAARLHRVATRICLRRYPGISGRLDTRLTHKDIGPKSLQEGRR